jgi:hypothetical protein
MYNIVLFVKLNPINLDKISNKSNKFQRRMLDDTDLQLESQLINHQPISWMIDSSLYTSSNIILFKRPLFHLHMQSMAHDILLIIYQVKQYIHINCPYFSSHCCLRE